jgi:hypothetical protein
MEQVTANVTTKARRSVVGGRERLIADMVLIVPGVLRGSQGALYYPPDEVAKDPSAWNGVPLLLNHPTDNGNHVSGRTPGVWEKALLGHVFNATVGADGRLRAEGHFDAEALRRFDPRLLGSLTEGRPLELSTGLYTENEPAPPGSEHGGKPYSHVARRYRPDHVAVLPDDRGACSIADGCGVLVNEAQAKTVLGRLLDWAAKTLGGADGVSMAVETAGRGPTENAGGFESEDQQRAFFGLLKDGKLGGDKGGKGGAGPAGGAGVRLGHPHADAASERADRASAAAAASGSREDHRRAAAAHDRAAVAHENAALDKTTPAVTAGMRARTSKDEGTRRENDATSRLLYGEIAAHDAQRLYHEAKVEEHRAAAKAVRNETDPAANAQPRHPGTGNFLPAGADVVPTDEQRRLGHDALVQKQSGHNPPSWAVDEALWEKAKEQADKAGHEEDWAYVVGIYQQMGGKIEGKSTRNSEGATVDRAKLIVTLTANCGGCSDEDKAAFGKLSDAALAALAGNAGMACPPGMDPEKWAGMSDAEKKKYLEDRADGGADDATENPDGSKKKMAGNVQTPDVRTQRDVRGAPVANAAPAKPPTINEWLAAMPPEARGVWDNAVQIERRERTALVDRLVANVQGEPKQALAKRLSGKPLDELRELTALLPPPAEPQVPAVPHYWGAAGAPAANAAKDDSDNLLPEVTLNFDELAAPALRRKQAQ